MQQWGQDYWIPRDFELPGERMATFKTTAVILYETDADDSSAVDLRGYGKIGLIVPVLEDQSNITFFVSETENGTYRQLRAGGGGIVTITLAGVVAAISSDALAPLEAYRWVKIRTTVEQTANRTFIWILKG